MAEAPLSDDELLGRRISQPEWYDSDLGISEKAFSPKRQDQTGLSLYRLRYRSCEELGRTQKGNKRHVAVLKVGAIRELGLELRVDEQQDNPGHVELPALRYETKRQGEVLAWTRKLAAISRPIWPFADTDDASST